MKRSTRSSERLSATSVARELWFAGLLGLFVFVPLVIYWAARIRLAYSPAGDEFSLLAHSARVFHPQPGEWLLHGFSGYFSPYPDLSLPYSNFIRPMANVTYFAQSLLFGRHWSLYLLGSYAIAAALVGTGWFLARVCLRLRPSLALLATASCAFSPAFNYLVVFRPSFAFDLLGGLFALLVLSTLLRSRWLAAWLLVWCAVFTKESAYYAAPAACIAVFLLQSKLPAARRLLSASLYLLPLACILILRRLDFAGVQGVYVLNRASGTGPVGRALLGLTHWPYVLPGPGRVRVFAMGMTGIVWCLLLLVAFEAVQRREGGGSYSGRGLRMWRAAAQHCRCSLCFCLAPCCCRWGSISPTGLVRQVFLCFSSC